MQIKWHTMQKMLTQLLLLSVGIFLGMMLTKSCQATKQTEILTEIVKTDTVTITRIDTVTVIKPQPYKVEVRDTVYINDTINDTINGSIFVQEVKTYQDSTYKAQISGINAYLDYIEVYPRTEYKYIHTTEKVYEKQKKWGIGVQFGYGAGKNGLQPYIGVGVQYDILRF